MCYHRKPNIQYDPISLKKNVYILNVDVFMYFNTHTYRPIEKPRKMYTTFSQYLKLEMEVGLWAVKDWILWKLNLIQIWQVGDCSQEIKSCLLLGRKALTNLGNVLKSRDITLLTKVHLVQAMVFPIVMYGCESWTIKKAEH